MIPGRTNIPKSGYFHDETNISKTNLRVNNLMLKMLLKAMYFASPDLGQITKFNPNMQDFKRVLDLTRSKGSNFFNWLSILKNLRFEMALKTCKM